MPFHHGAYCRLRSFPTKCPVCKSPVLYWECTHGARVFFDYPIYGKAIRHICQKRKSSKSRVAITQVQQNQQQLEVATYQCPVCGKIFDKEQALARHINQMKKQEDNHAVFFGFQLDLIDFDSEIDNPQEILEQSNALDCKDNEFDLSDLTQDLSKFKTKQNLRPNQQEFFTLKSKKNI